MRLPTIGSAQLRSSAAVQTPGCVEPRSPARPSPVGVVALLLAFAIASVVAIQGQEYSVCLAEPYVHALADKGNAIKWTGITFQRAALRDGHMLPIYGSSEFYNGYPNVPAVFFRNEPSGFDVFEVGQAGTEGLFFLETFGALGNDLRGKKLVLSESPAWFLGNHQGRAADYAGNFSPEIAEMFIFDSPIALDLKEAGARRMLAYPTPLADQPILRLAVLSLSGTKPLSPLGYFALYPVGRLDSEVRQLQDAWHTIQFIEANPKLAKSATATIAPERSTDEAWWISQLATATARQERDVGNDPFGFPPNIYNALRSNQDLHAAWLLYYTGGTNRDDEVYPSTDAWQENLETSTAWQDLELELSELHELGAKPFVYTVPLAGDYYNYTVVSRRNRLAYYHYFLTVAGKAHVPAVTFAQNDEDRYFYIGPAGHFSQRGWVIANRAIDLFWHGTSVTEINAAIDDLDRHVPPVGPAPPPPNITQLQERAQEQRQFATLHQTTPSRRASSRR